MLSRSRPDPWVALIARTKALLSGAKLFYMGAPKDIGLATDTLLEQVKRIVGELGELRRTHADAISYAAKECVDRCLAQKWWDQVGDGIPAARMAIVVLTSHISELEYHLSDREPQWSHLVQRAFLHLDRILVVDSAQKVIWTGQCEVLTRSRPWRPLCMSI